MEWLDCRWLLAKEQRYGWKAMTRVARVKREKREGLDESLEERRVEEEGWLLSITQAGWKPRGRLCVTPLWNTSRNSSANRPKFWNFNSTARKSLAIRRIDRYCLLSATRTDAWKWLFAGCMVFRWDMAEWKFRGRVIGTDWLVVNIRGKICGTIRIKIL